MKVEEKLGKHASWCLGMEWSPRVYVSIQENSYSATIIDKPGLNVKAFFSPACPSTPTVP